MWDPISIQVDPSVMENIDLDKAIRAIFEGNGVPVRVLRPSDDVIEIRRTQAIAMEKDRQMQQMMAGGETVAKLLPGMAKMQEVQGSA